jgi:hypothetical protein
MEDSDGWVLQARMCLAQGLLLRLRLVPQGWVWAMGAGRWPVAGVAGVAEVAEVAGVAEVAEVAGVAGVAEVAGGRASALRVGRPGVQRVFEMNRLSLVLGWWETEEGHGPEGCV